MVHGIENWKCDDRLKLFGLTRLHKGRIRSDLVETYKTLNGMIDKGLFFDLDDGGRRGHKKETIQKKISFA